MSQEFGDFRVLLVRQRAWGKQETSLYPPEEQAALSLSEALQAKDDFLRRGMGIVQAEIIPVPGTTKEQSVTIGQ